MNRKWSALPFKISKNKHVCYKASLLFFCLVLFPFCADESPSQTVPFAPVYFRLHLNGIDHSLRNPLSYKIFTEQDRRSDGDRFGYGGLLITSDAAGAIFYAYDLCCPHEKKRDLTVVPREDGTAVCPTCGSIFVTMYGHGTIEKGPSVDRLQRYRVISEPSGIYRIVN